MVTTIKFNGVDYYCTNCRMTFQKLLPECPFCGYVCSNYEEIVMDLLKNAELEDVKKVVDLEILDREKV